MTTHAHNILALDLGTNTGYAVQRRDGSQRYGTVKYTKRKMEHPGHRWAEFRTWLSVLLETEQIHLVVYEDVRRHEGTMAAHVYGAFEALMQMGAVTRNIPVVPVGVGVVKKAWTGFGNASKAAMIDEARRRGFDPDTDNAADALAILHWAVVQEQS